MKLFPLAETLGCKCWIYGDFCLSIIAVDILEFSHVGIRRRPDGAVVRAQANLQVSRSMLIHMVDWKAWIMGVKRWVGHGWMMSRIYWILHWLTRWILYSRQEG